MNFDLFYVSELKIEDESIRLLVLEVINDYASLCLLGYERGKNGQLDVDTRREKGYGFLCFLKSFFPYIVSFSL